jgi:hypothetical protein
MVEPDLFAPSVPVDTSISAANATRPHLNRLEQEVYDTLRRLGGLTALELEAITGMKGSTLRPRLWSLCGNAPAGCPKPAARIWMTDEKRRGARVYRVL